MKEIPTYILGSTANNNLIEITQEVVDASAWRDLKIHTAL